MRRIWGCWQPKISWLQPLLGAAALAARGDRWLGDPGDSTEDVGAKSQFPRSVAALFSFVLV